MAVVLASDFFVSPKADKKIKFHTMRMIFRDRLISMNTTILDGI